MRTFLFGLLAVYIGLATIVPCRVALAQGGAVPNLGDPVLEDPLSKREAFRPYFCPTGRNSAQYGDEGYTLRVTGKCTEAAPTAYLVHRADYLTLADGEVSVEVKFGAGFDRARFLLWTRVSEGGGYHAAWEPRQGLMQIVKRQGDRNTVIQQRTDLMGSVSQDTWATLALRVQGASLWVLLNGEPVVSAVDATLDSGGVSLALARLGNPTDDDPAAVTLRTLRVSPIAGGDLARSPAYQPPATAVTRPDDPGFVAPVGTPPEVGARVLERPLTEGGTVPTGACPTGRASVEQADDGILFKVRGRCREDVPGAFVSSFLPRLVVPDGEIRLEAKVVSGGRRAALAVYTRGGPADGGSTYAMLFAPAAGNAEILSVVNRHTSVIAARTDLQRLFSPDDWNTVAIRMEGARLWVFVNDRPVLSAEDSSLDSGNVGLALVRGGPIDDGEEAAVVIRNLAVSTIAGSDSARVPSYQSANARRPSAPGGPSGADLGVPPAVGAVVAQNTLVSTRQELVPLVFCAFSGTSIEGGVEGVVFRVGGRCDESYRAALVQTVMAGLTIPDGEFRFEMKALSGGPRVEMHVATRLDPSDGNRGYVAVLVPGEGAAFLLRISGQEREVVQARSDLGAVFKLDDWNSVAMRLDGPNLWLLVNEQPVLSAADASYDTGRVALRLVRTGDPEDDEPVAVVLRNLRVSSIAGSAPERAPTYQPR